MIGQLLLFCQFKLAKNFLISSFGLEVGFRSIQLYRCLSSILRIIVTFVRHLPNRFASNAMYPCKFVSQNLPI